MNVPSPQSRRRAGFSLLEIIIAIAIIAILVGVVGFRSGSAIQRGQASRILQLVKSMEKACATYYADTGDYAREFEVTQAASRRELSATQTTTGWQGPYIDRPMADQDTNPFGRARIYDSLQAGNWIPGFDTDGDGTADLTGSGNLMYLTQVPQEVVDAIDQALDGGIPGNPYTTGRVVWQQGANRTLIYVFK